MVAAFSLLMQACTQERVMQVVVSSVGVAPTSVTVVVGEEVALTATVRDDHGEIVQGALPAWSSEKPSVATVDSAGVVRGLAEGSASVSATFGGAAATAEVRVVPGPGIETSNATVALVAGAGGSPPPPEIVHVSNSGTGPLTGLSAEVEHPTGVPGWLQATLAATTAPTSLTLTASIDGLEAGMWSATVLVASSLPDVPHVEIPVTLTLTGFSLTETGDGTVVSEAGLVDTLTIALETPPSEGVVFAVRSSDPSEVAASPSTLSFEPGTWDVPQPIVVSGVDDFADDGDQRTDLTISVVAVASDDAFAGVPPRTIAVTTIDNDDAPGLIVTETGDIRVSESGTTATFTVALTTQPATDVVLTVTSGDRGEVLVTPSTLIFRSSTWSEAQTVTVIGVDDSADDGDQVTAVTLAVVAVVSDDAFDAVPAQTVLVTNTDND